MTAETTMCVAVTGANGYVGSRIARALQQSGARVVRLQRARTDDAVRRFALGEPIERTVFDGVDALVHCAYDFGASTWGDIHRVNVEGSIALFRAAHEAGVRRMVFISTMSAFSGCRSMYGRAKLEVEGAARALGVAVVRPGLVYGGESGGMIGALRKLLKLPLVTPLVGSGRQVLYLVHEDDLGAMIATLCASDRVPDSPVIAAHARPFELREILRILGRQTGRRTALLPVPWQLEWLALRGAETAGLRMRLRSDSLVSLMNQDPSPDFSTSASYEFRDFERATLGAAST
jgi:nucleoside-diphosphate-sugar epimerase